MLAERIRANANRQMLAINDKLGFTYAWHNTLWQLSIAQDPRGSRGPRESLSKDLGLLVAITASREPTHELGEVHPEK